MKSLLINLILLTGLAALGQTIQPPANTSQVTNMAAQGYYVSPAGLGDFYNYIMVPYVATHSSTSSNEVTLPQVTNIVSAATSGMVTNGSVTFVSGYPESGWIGLYDPATFNINSIESIERGFRFVDGDTVSIITMVAGNISATSFSGSGYGLTNLPPSGMAPGTLATTVKISPSAVTNDGTTFAYGTVESGNTNLAGRLIYTNAAGQRFYTANGGSLTNLNLTNTFGTLPLAQLPSGVVTNTTTNFSVAATGNGVFGGLAISNGAIHSTFGNLTLDSGQLVVNASGQGIVVNDSGAICWSRRCGFFSGAAGRINMFDTQTWADISGSDTPRFSFGAERATNSAIVSIRGATPSILIIDATGTNKANLLVSGTFIATNGVSSLATNTPAASASGFTNATGLACFAAIDGVAFTYTLYNNKGTAIYTNPVTMAHDFAPVQNGGKILVTAGTGVAIVPFAF